MADESVSLLSSTGDVRGEMGSDGYESINNSDAGDTNSQLSRVAPRTDRDRNQGGVARGWRVLSLVEREFLVVAVLTGLTTVGLTSHRLHLLVTSARPLSTGIVMLISEVFSLYYNIHGVIFERFYEIIIFIIAIFVDIIYCTVDFALLPSPTNFEKFRLGIDWFLGCLVPTFLAYYVITRVYFKDGVRRGVRPLDLFRSLLVLDLQLAVCNVVLIVTDIQVETEEIAILIVGEAVNLVFFCIGMFAIRDRTQDVCGCIFNVVGLVPFGYLVYKSIKLKDDIAKGEYLAVASLVFSLLSIITRVIVLVFHFCIWRGARDSQRPGRNPDGGSATRVKQVAS